MSKSYIRSAVEASLQRLQTDHIDLYQSHRDDLETPQQETLGAYEELIRDGKVRAIGASNFTAARLKEALEISAELGLPRYESLQPKYNLHDRAEYEAELEPLCRQEEIGVIPYYGLASGFLTGKYRSEADFGKSVRGGRMAAYLDDRGRRILAALDAGRRPQGRDSGPGRPGLAHGAPGTHRADCQRHEGGAGAGHREGDAAAPRSRPISQSSTRPALSAYALRHRNFAWQPSVASDGGLIISYRPVLHIDSTGQNEVL